MFKNQQMDFDVLILGGGAAGMSCALVLGSARNKIFAENKNIGIILHQRSSALDRAVFYNVLGVKPGITGKEILRSGAEQLSTYYPHIQKIEKEKVNSVLPAENGFEVLTNKNSYTAKRVVVAVSPSNLFNIEGLNEYIIPHQKIIPEKEKVQLKNIDHLVMPGIHVAGVLAGHRSQLSIACGSGAAVATDILTEWNGGNHTVIHDAIEE